MRRAAAGSLYRLSVLYGGSGHPGGHYPADARHARIQWDRAPHEVFVFCSRQLPSVIYADNGTLGVAVLDFAGLIGADEGAANLYVRVCHPGEDWASEGFTERHGYPEFEETPEIHLDRPEDIFGFVR